MKKKILVIAMIFVIALGVTSCASFERGMKDMKSELSGGLKRTVNVYGRNGDLIASYEGKIDIEDSDNCNKVKFELDGKRYIYYNCQVEVIEK
jgi:predicted small secreted protein